MGIVEFKRQTRLETWRQVKADLEQAAGGEFFD